MRKIVVLEHLSLDGVIQGPGGPTEDATGGFALGGWIGAYSDPILGEHFRRQMQQNFDLLLGRRTYDIWAPYWPLHNEVWPQANAATKYVVSRTRTKGDWEHTVFLNDDVAERVRKIQRQPGPDLHVWGSSQLVQELVRNDLIDEFWLVVYPVVLGSGKRLFADSLVPRALRVIESTATPSGVLVTRYQRSDSASSKGEAKGDDHV
jgi:dihydrofolate reductase